MDDKALENLLTRLVAAENKRQRRVLVLNVLHTGLFVTCILYGLLLCLFPYIGIDPKPYDRFVSCMPTLGALGILFRCLSAATYPEKKLLQAVLNYDDVRAVGALVDALEYTVRDGSDLHKTVVVALTRLLSGLYATQSVLLNKRQRALLNDKLKRVKSETTVFPHYADFYVAILKAWEQVGEKSELPQVERLATMQARSEQARRVQEAARACLPLLQARVEQEGLGNTLLRSANAGGAVDVLLRPAAGAADTQEPMLLRATCGAEEK